MRRTAFTPSEKSYGGYSTHSLPTRNAEGEEKKRDVPKYVSDKAEEIKSKQKTEDEGKAFAVAWSIYCKYKDPSSRHCKKDADEYFPSRNKKKAYLSREEEAKVKAVTLKISAVLDQWVSKGLLEAIKIIKAHAGAHDDRMVKLVMYMWTSGKYPTFLLKYGKEAQIIGKLSGDLHHEEKPENVTYIEERRALKILVEIFKYFYKVWSARVWAKLWLMSGDVAWASIRLEMVNLRNRIEYGYHYTRLLRVMFPE